MEELIEGLKVQLIEILSLSDVTPKDFDEDAQLVGGDLGIDSIDVLEIVVMIEKEYGVVINNKEIAEQVFTSLRSLAEFIAESKQKTSS